MSNFYNLTDSAVEIDGVLHSIITALNEENVDKVLGIVNENNTVKLSAVEVESGGGGDVNIDAELNEVIIGDGDSAAKGSNCYLQTKDIYVSALTSGTLPKLMHKDKLSSFSIESLVISKETADGFEEVYNMATDPDFDLIGTQNHPVLAAYASPGNTTAFTLDDENRSVYVVGAVNFQYGSYLQVKQSFIDSTQEDGVANIKIETSTDVVGYKINWGDVNVFSTPGHLSIEYTAERVLESKNMELTTNKGSEDIVEKFVIQNIGEDGYSFELSDSSQIGFREGTKIDLENFLFETSKKDDEDKFFKMGLKHPSYNSLSAPAVTLADTSSFKLAKGANISMSGNSDGDKPKILMTDGSSILMNNDTAINMYQTSHIDMSQEASIYMSYGSDLNLSGTSKGNPVLYMDGGSAIRMHGDTISPHITMSAGSSFEMWGNGSGDDNPSFTMQTGAEVQLQSQSLFRMWGSGDDGLHSTLDIRNDSYIYISGSQDDDDVATNILIVGNGQLYDKELVISTSSPSINVLGAPTIIIMGERQYKPDDFATSSTPNENNPYIELVGSPQIKMNDNAKVELADNYSIIANDNGITFSDGTDSISFTIAELTSIKNLLQ